MNSTNGEPVVSVIIPVYNGERYFVAALESIVVPDSIAVEVIVVDDGSTDGSAAIAAGRSPSVRLIRQEHGGLPRARNRGLAEARGSLIAFLDADDLWSPDKLTLQLAAVGRHPDVAIVLGRTRRMWAAAPASGTGELAYGEPELALSFGSGLVRRSVFDAVGHFDESFTYCDDWEWFMARARARRSDWCAPRSDLVLPPACGQHDQRHCNRQSFLCSHASGVGAAAACTRSGAAVAADSARRCITRSVTNRASAW